VPDLCALSPRRQLAAPKLRVDSIEATVIRAPLEALRMPNFVRRQLPHSSGQSSSSAPDRAALVWCSGGMCTERCHSGGALHAHPESMLSRRMDPG
jgi:hypothetical protein